MSQLLRNIYSIISTFDKYAQKDGDCTSLSKAELKQLIQKEFVDVIVNPYDPKTIESVLQLLDTDCDGKVDFEEFTVLMFRVARACYEKTQECNAPSESQRKKGEGDPQQQPQDEQTLQKDSACRSAQGPQAAGEGPDCRPAAESQKPSQEQKPEPCKSGKEIPQPPKQEQDAIHQKPQKPSVAGPSQSNIQDQTTKQDPIQAAQTMRQDRTREPQTGVEDASRQHAQTDNISDRDQTQNPQISERRTTRQSVQLRQEEGRICQQDVPQNPDQQQPTCQPAYQKEQSRRQIERGEQDVTCAKPRPSQGTDRSPSGGPAQQPEDPKQRHICPSQAQQRSQVGVQEQVLEQQQPESPTHTNRPAHPQDCQPQGPGQTLTHHLEQERPVPEQIPSNRQERGSLTREQKPHQQDRRPQDPNQAPECCLGQGHQVPQQTPSNHQERGSLTREPKPCQQDRRPQDPSQTPECCSEQAHQVPQQTPSNCQEHGSLTREQKPCQQDRRPQDPSQTPECHPGQGQQVPEQTPSNRQERGSLTREQKPHQQDRRPQDSNQITECRPGQGQQVPEQTPSNRQERGSLTREQKPHQQDRRPQDPNQTPECCPGQGHQVPQQTSSNRQERGSLTGEQKPCQQHRPQNPDQIQECRPGQGHQVPQQSPFVQECGSSVETRFRQQQSEPQNTDQPRYCYEECGTLSPEQGPPPHHESVPQAREVNWSYEVTQDAEGSSTRQSLKTWSFSQQKKLQFPSPWSSKQ